MKKKPKRIRPPSVTLTFKEYFELRQKANRFERLLSLIAKGKA